MVIAQKLKDYLDEENVEYEILNHAEAFTAPEIAGSKHIPGKQFAKTVIVKGDNKYYVCVLPAIHLIDFDKLKYIIKSKEIELVKEDEIAHLFPDFQIGAEPPFGNLYGLPIYVDEILQENDEIVINAGTHTDLVRMKWRDFKRLTQPILGNFGKHIT
jgi:Ala-tRNA(Pro) deacylase